MTDRELLRRQRRAFLQTTGCGFGTLAAQAMHQQAEANSSANSSKSGAAAGIPGEGTLHHAPRAKRVIFLFMQGGVSQIDSFDHKPALAEHDGQAMPFDDARTIAKSGMRGSQQHVMNSPWRFRQYGQTGRWVSDLFPETARHADDLCFLHAMHTDGVAHGPATLFLHCGSTNFVRPSIGSWLYYALGSENANLPGFVSIAPSIGNGGVRNYGNAFLPARFQGTRVGNMAREELDIDSLTRDDIPADAQRRQLDLIQSLNRAQVQRRSLGGSELDAVIESYDMAGRMQRVAPELLDLSTESEQTQTMYGLDDKETRSYGRRCLLARRLCEAGVRFIQVNYGDNSANPAWDQHTNLPKHETHARRVDRPIAALLTDLKRRGLLEDTIVWWGSEFGRTPYSQNNGTGRDHNPGGFTVWLAGGGFRPGLAYGATDEFGFAGVRGKVHMHDLHATILHQLGLDHKRLTYEYAGRPFRLTDVYGHVVHDVLA